MDRKTATILTNLEEQGFKNEADLLLRASLKKVAESMPLFQPHQKVSLVYHNRQEALAGVVVGIDERTITVASSTETHEYRWTGEIFEDLDASSTLSIPVAILPEYNGDE